MNQTPMESQSSKLITSQTNPHRKLVTTSQKYIMISQTNLLARSSIQKVIRTPQPNTSNVKFFSSNLVRSSQNTVQFPTQSTVSTKKQRFQATLTFKDIFQKNPRYQLDLLRKNGSETSIKTMTKIALPPLNLKDKDIENDHNFLLDDVSFALSEEPTPSIDRSHMSVWEDNDQTKQQIEDFNKVTNPVQQWASLFKHRYENFPDKQKLTQLQLKSFFNLYGHQSKNKWRQMIYRFPIDYSNLPNFEESEQQLVKTQLPTLSSQSVGNLEFQNKKFIIRKQ